jgi:hypothetical protein
MKTATLTVATKTIVITNIGFTSHRAYEGFAVKFNANDDSHVVVFETEKEAADFIALLDGETMTGDEFNDMLAMGTHYCANCGGAMYIYF